MKETHVHGELVAAFRTASWSAMRWPDQPVSRMVVPPGGPCRRLHKLPGAWPRPVARPGGSGDRVITPVSTRKDGTGMLRSAARRALRCPVKAESGGR